MPRQAGYFGHVKARNELSIFKQNAPPPHPYNRTTAPADSTTDPMLNRKRLPIFPYLSLILSFHLAGTGFAPLSSTSLSLVVVLKFVV